MFINHPQILRLQKLSSPLGLFGFKSFHEFFMVGGRIEPIACIVFYLVFSHKNDGKPLQKTISKMANGSKNIQKTSKCSTENTQKETNIILSIFRCMFVTPLFL